LYFNLFQNQTKTPLTSIKLVVLYLV